MIASGRRKRIGATPSGMLRQIPAGQQPTCFGTLQEVDRCLQSVEENPEAGVVLRGSVRRRLLRRFPYALIYRIKPNGIQILAVMNLKRRPAYWAGRE